MSKLEKKGMRTWRLLPIQKHETHAKSQLGWCHSTRESVSPTQWLGEKSGFPRNGHLKMKWSFQGKLAFSRWKSIDFLDFDIRFLHQILFLRFWDLDCEETAWFSWFWHQIRSFLVLSLKWQFRLRPTAWVVGEKNPDTDSRVEWHHPYAQNT